MGERERVAGRVPSVAGALSVDTARPLDECVAAVVDRIDG